MKNGASYQTTTLSSSFLHSITFPEFFHLLSYILEHTYLVPSFPLYFFFIVSLYFYFYCNSILVSTWKRRLLVFLATTSLARYFTVYEHQRLTRISSPSSSSLYGDMKSTYTYMEYVHKAKTKQKIFFS